MPIADTRLAQHEWARLKSNDSLEYCNCHSAGAMDFSKQAVRAAEIHGRYLISGRATCIDCHRGTSHMNYRTCGVSTSAGRYRPKWKEHRCQAHAVDELKRVIAGAQSMVETN